MVSLHDSPRFQSSYFATGTLCKWWHFHHNLMKDWCLGIRQGAVLMGCVVSGYSIIYGKITAGCATLISILTAIPWKTMCEAQTKKWELDRDWLCLGPAQHIPSSDMENWAKFCKRFLPGSFSFLLSFPGKWKRAWDSLDPESELLNAAIFIQKMQGFVVKLWRTLHIKPAEHLPLWCDNTEKPLTFSAQRHSKDTETNVDAKIIWSSTKLWCVWVQLMSFSLN